MVVQGGAFTISWRGKYGSSGRGVHNLMVGGYLVVQGVHNCHGKGIHGNFMEEAEMGFNNICNFITGKNV
jgi:hypothetical protein